RCEFDGNGTPKNCREYNTSSTAKAYKTIGVWVKEGGSTSTSTTTAAAGFEHNRTYELKPSHATNKCVDVYAMATYNGANIHLWDCFGHGGQRFTAQSQGGGWFVLRNVYSGKCIETMN